MNPPYGTNTTQLTYKEEFGAFSNILSCLPTRQTRAVEKAMYYFLQYVGITLENIAITFPLQEAVKALLKSSRQSFTH